MGRMQHKTTSIIFIIFTILFWSAFIFPLVGCAAPTPEGGYNTATWSESSSYREDDSSSTAIDTPDTYTFTINMNGTVYTDRTNNITDKGLWCIIITTNGKEYATSWNNIVFVGE